MEHPRLTTDDIAHLAEGNSPATVDLDYDEACTAMAQELLAIRRASQAAPAPSDHAISKEWAERMLPLDEGVTPSAGAPAPSDELAQIDAMLMEGQGDDDGDQVLPDFEPGWSVAAKVEACLHLLEKRRASQAVPAPSDGLREALEQLEAKASAVSSAHARKGNIGFAVAEMGPTIMSARAALSTPTEERQ